MEVEGVACITPEGRKHYRAKGGVILTTGGFGANEAMVCQYIGPWASRLIVRGSPWITGENILMTQEVHAKLVNMDQFYAGPITPTGHANPSPLMHAGYGIQVGTNGKHARQPQLHADRSGRGRERQHPLEHDQALLALGL